MPLPEFRDWTFSVKTFATAILALYVALWLQLDSPYWSMITVYVLAQPLAGPMLAKAGFRLLGTVLGALVGVILVTCLVDAPPLLVVALAAWCGLTLTVSQLDRTPRGYIFSLSGVTAAIVGYGSASNPLQAATVALDRVEEITLGIVATSLVLGVVFPRPLGPVLLTRLDAMRGAIVVLVREALGSGGETATACDASRTLAAGVGEVTNMIAQLRFDTSPLYAATVPVTALLSRMSFLLPAISDVGARVAALRQAGILTPALQDLLDRIDAWVASPDDDPTPLRAAIDAMLMPADQPSAQPGILIASLLHRLKEMLAAVRDSAVLQRHVAKGEADLPALWLQTGLEPDGMRFRDLAIAALSGLAIALGLLVTSSFWIASAWPLGGTAAIYCAIACIRGASADDPSVSIMVVTKANLVAIILAAIVAFGVLPSANNFEMLVLGAAPVFLMFGLFSAQAKTSLFGMIGGAHTAGLLALTDHYSAQFATFANLAVAIMLGNFAGATTMTLVRKISAAWYARRLQRLNRRDLASFAAGRSQISPQDLISVMLDRLVDLTARLPRQDADADAVLRAALRDMRVGLNLLALDQGPAGADSLHTALGALAQHYQADAAPDEALRAQIDRAVDDVVADPDGRGSGTMAHLMGIRHGLFPDAQPYGMTPANGRAA